MNAHVIVVGAGPVGLMMAGELRLGGADVVVYDKLSAATGESRALGFTKRVAEVFDQRGLLTRLGQLRWGDSGHFGGIAVGLDGLEDDHRRVVGVPQARTEEMLAGWLAELGVPVRRGYEAVEVRETADGLTAVFDGPHGRHEDTAGYLVGCDGGQSTVRSAAGFETSGWESTRTMYMADVTGVEIRPRPVGERYPGGNMVLIAPLGNGYYRVLVHDRSLPARPGPGALPFTAVADALQRVTGESIHHGQARWVHALGNGARLAAQYRRGRVFLAGEAAHDTPPMAAWGLSVGIQDAVNLGWKLAAATNGWAPDGLLDTYHTERHPLGEQLLRNTHAGAQLYLTGEETEPLRDVLRELVTYPAVADYFAGMVSGLRVRYDTGTGDHPLLGRRLPPDLELALPGRSRVRIADLLHPARGVFVTTDGTHGADRLTAGWSDRVDVVTGDWTTPPRTALDAVLIRPDGYVAWAGPGGGDLPAALDRWFGAARTTVSA